MKQIRQVIFFFDKTSLLSSTVLLELIELSVMHAIHFWLLTVQINHAESFRNASGKLGVRHNVSIISHAVGYAQSQEM